MLIILCIIFISLILLVGGNSSAKSLITISLNTLMLLSVIFFIYKGFNPLTVSIPACVLISIIAVFYQNGYKTPVHASENTPTAPIRNRLSKWRITPIMPIKAAIRNTWSYFLILRSRSPNRTENWNRTKDISKRKGTRTSCKDGRGCVKTQCLGTPSLGV